MERIIVLGIGNQLMMDDGIGIYLIPELEKLLQIPNTQFLIGESDIDYCLGKIDGATLVFIIDAALSGKEPGEISVYEIQDLHEKVPLNLSPHNFHLFQVLFLQRDRIKGYLIGIEPEEIKFHIGLSQKLSCKWHDIICEVKKIVEELVAKREKN